MLCMRWAITCKLGRASASYLLQEGVDRSDNLDGIVYTSQDVLR